MTTPAFGVDSRFSSIARFSVVFIKIDRTIHERLELDLEVVVFFSSQPFARYRFDY